jgi:hypothetical protein
MDLKIAMSSAIGIDREGTFDGNEIRRDLF